ncbi:MAG: hypothetical protein KDB07_01665, partial [Planctomycetes bacterium]|nr:hypothetical protein [Planctomycetota bacterium]
RPWHEKLLLGIGFTTMIAFVIELGVGILLTTVDEATGTNSTGHPRMWFLAFLLSIMLLVFEARHELRCNGARTPISLVSNIFLLRLVLFSIVAAITDWSSVLENDFMLLSTDVFAALKHVRVLLWFAASAIAFVIVRRSRRMPNSNLHKH